MIVTVVYILVAIAAIGLVPADKLAGADAPLTEAIRSGAGLRQLGRRHHVASARWSRSPASC